MAFRPHDFVRYSGTIGQYRGRIREIDGPRHIVEVDRLGRIVCGAEDLTADGDALLAAQWQAGEV